MLQTLEVDVEVPMLKLAVWHWELASTITATINNVFDYSVFHLQLNSVITKNAWDRPDLFFITGIHYKRVQAWIWG
jgi:hypothetical protein